MVGGRLGTLVKGGYAGGGNCLTISCLEGLYYDKLGSHGVRKS